MSLIKGFIYKYKKSLIFILLIAISIFLLFSSSSSAVITFKKMGESVLYPFQFVFFSTSQFFQNTFNSISELKKSQEEIKNLRNELEQYKQIVINFNELNNEIINLKQILQLKQEISYNSTACEVVARDPKSLFDVLIINKGSNDGIKENMPVISYSSGKRTLVGKVVEVTPFSSKVLTLQNPILNVGSIISSSRSHVVIQGSNKSTGIAKLLYLPKDFYIQPNDPNLVYTSGDSLLFPAGIEIGQIIKIYQSKRYEIFNEADVKLSADLSKVDFVLVLKIDYNQDDFKLEYGGL
jgi:rod shape-determining protein MreC